MRVEREVGVERSTLQHPVKSSRGGYLRCPFDIDPAFALTAERHAAGGSLSHESHRLHAVRGSGDGHDADNNEDDICRPWNRAGVGAKALSAKERRLQQQEAESIYGSIATNNADEKNEDASTASDAGLAVALSSWEKTALQRVVPRGVLKKKAQRNGESCTEAMSDEGRHKVGRQQRHQHVVGDKREAEGRTLSVGVGRPCRKMGDGGHQSAHPRETGESCAPRKTEEQSIPEENKPLNRLQKLDAMRNAALFGKKKMLSKR
ncbi:hypothetical protein TraAM80_07081 [Trypanosoma rangeli]|uniref:Uncharacterized protein n=1 Tax=Trypanosoma rangeli TaxID=5698 RepID=A0A422N7B9_TRYRA|nr:uncharacterized protein TraAM80_07081 [Trypanosoma rangeli]RNF01360.1 hypothetical protein TraAM80_07081 [Trypanosoma rangeli]|eukprot:RNF01360.1 hypothetical protein TraAM80_07081 [Trypanosoma rangeli]